VVARPLRDPAIPVERVVVGIPVGWLAAQARRELLGTMVVIAPVLIVLSVGAAFLLAGHTLTPLERLMTQLEAITDGRSLHRRLSVDDSGDEIARLSATLNAMLGRLENYFGALRRFTADASHELKTPLTVLRADVERAMNANTTATERLVALEEALQETTRMADLVEQLLTLARADEGRFDLHREPVALGPVVRDVLETALILGEEGGIGVRTPVLEDVTVMGDGARLRQLFLNLVTNAIKYTPRGGEVEIALRKAGDVITFSVRDTGIGIAAADLPYIFDRFWRADRVRSRSGARGGFGLGLAISQWIAQAHGGSLTATSRLGRGSVFTVTLPLAPDGSTAEYPIPRLAQLAGHDAAD
ncbi:MAG TPA: HAMP domain-containing sensor histidine kinase, partial [Gemmatimonadaceae bacterium]|nr:HAMP domain-containing sensor histidine kinase [Gemmatimonadaceae bacterium]